MSKDLRHIIDLSPWCKDGGSWMGLKRDSAKAIALALIILSALMACPPFIPSPDDAINIFLAGFLIKFFPGVNELVIFGLTYTVIPFAMLLLGLWIYPHNTRSLFNGKVNLVQRWFKRQKFHQLIFYFFASALVLYIYHKYLITGGLLNW